MTFNSCFASKKLWLVNFSDNINNPISWYESFWVPFLQREEQQQHRMKVMQEQKKTPIIPAQPIQNQSLIKIRSLMNHENWTLTTFTTFTTNAPQIHISQEACIGKYCKTVLAEHSGCLEHRYQSENMDINLNEN